MVGAWRLFIGNPISRRSQKAGEQLFSRLRTPVENRPEGKRPGDSKFSTLVLVRRL